MNSINKQLTLLGALVLPLILFSQQNPNSLAFDGNNNYISLGNNNNLKPTTSITVESWVNLNNWNASNTEDIVSTFSTYGYLLKYQSGTLQGVVYRNGTSASASTNVSALTGWHHVAFTFDGRYIRLYLDGVLKNTNNAGATYPIQYDSSSVTTIGSNSLGTTEFFNGEIDEVRFWSVARSAAQLSGNMNTEISTSTANLIAYFRFNQGIANGSNSGQIILNDLTSNAINGTLINFALNGSLSNWTDGYPLKPFDQSTNVTFSNVLPNQMTLSWIRPGSNKGGNSVKVFMKQTTTGYPLPIDGANYIANSTFGLGTQIDTSGWYCIYDGNSTSVTVTNLLPSISYRAKIIEYQSVIGLVTRYCITNVTGNPANKTTDLSAPTVQSSNITFSSIIATSFKANWTRGNGSNCIVFVNQTATGTASPIINTTYAASSVFGHGTQIGATSWYCVYKGTGTSVTITGMNSNTTYRVMVCEYNGSTGSENYLSSSSTNNPNNQTTDFIAPTTQALNITFSSITGSSFTANWTRGNGSRCIAFIKQTTAGNASPVNDTTYIANSNYSSGSQIGTTGWYCVYKDTGTSVNITGMNPGIAYRVMICEFNGTTGLEKYLKSASTNNPMNQSTDFIMPTVQASNITFSVNTSTYFRSTWTRGNGSSCVVFVKQTTTGTAAPVINTTYSANSIFGNGSQIGTTGWYCVYKGTGTTVLITGLSSATTYTVMVCEYNGTAGKEKYNTSTSINNPNNQTTDFIAPTTQALNITFSSITGSSFTANWTRGNGSRCIAFIKQTTAGNASPVNDTTYIANSNYSSGSQIGTTGWYCVYKDTGTSVNITGMNPGIAYRVMICEFNGTTGLEKYLKSASTNNPMNQSTDFIMPTVQASNITFSVNTSTYFRSTWTRGNGSSCVVFVKQTTTGTAAPVINTTYSANSIFGNGSQIGTTGWYCVYKGTGTTVLITGLSSATTYTVMVCEYNGTAGKEKYNTSTSISNPNLNITLPITTWNGTSWNNGAPTSGTAAVISGNYNQTIDITCKSLYINKSIIMNVMPGKALTVNSDFTNYGILNLKSPLDSAASGSFIAYGQTTNFGTMNAERYIAQSTLQSTDRTWHTLSAPISNYSEGMTYSGDYVCKYLEASNTWVKLKTGDSIYSMIGYIVKTINSGGQVINYSGTFNTGTQQISVINSKSDALHGYNSIGNPYPSAIDWNASTGWTKTNITGTIWIWNPVTLVYATWDGTVGINGGSQYIPAMQGFFIQVSAGNSSGLIGMTDAIRVHSTQTFLKSGKVEPELIRLKTSGNNFSDELVFYKSNGPNTAYKLFSDSVPVPQIYYVNENSLYSIFKVSPDISDTTFQIGFRCIKSGEYSISADQITFDTTNLSFYLVDNVTNNSIRLSPGTVYKFNYIHGENEFRFNLQIKSNQNNITLVKNDQNESFKVWSSSGKIYFNIPFEGASTVLVYDAIGRNILIRDFNSKGIYNLEMSKSGIYFVNVNNNGQTYNKKVYVK